MIPDWIPNIHPLIVHFPIALLVVAVLFDVARLFFKKQEWLHNAVLALYTTGTLGLVAAFLTGRQAVDTVSVTGEAIAVVTTHEDWALYTLIYFAVFTLLRFWTWWENLEMKQGVLSVMIVLAFAGTGLLWYTGERGTELVYRHGVAVGEIDRLQQQIEELQQDLAAFRGEAEPVMDENGSWVWRIAPGAGDALAESFAVEGNQNVHAEPGREDDRYHLELQVDGGETAFLLMDNNPASIEGRIELNVSDFDGEFMLVHHYQNPENYQYLKLAGPELIQGQVINGSDNILESGSIEAELWMTLHVTANGRHFYGYKNQQTITHSHSDEMEPGKTGFALSGGTVKIRLIEFTAL